MASPDPDHPSARLAPLRRHAADVLRAGARAIRVVAEAALDVLRTVARRWTGRDGARLRELRRRNAVPLPNLYDLHPEVRAATPRELGVRSVDIDEIAGTAVAGHAQRGSDFLPLPAFRSRNWESRYQRILRAIDRLAILPPVDLVRFAGRYWVSDGHNRVAAAHVVGQVEVDANVTEYVLPGQNPSERPDNLAAALSGTRDLRAAGRGGRVHASHEDIQGAPRRRPDDPAEPLPPAIDPPTAESPDRPEPAGP